MSDIQITECKDNERESEEYWNRRLEVNWNKPYHGMYFDSKELIDKMDYRNFGRILKWIEITYREIRTTDLKTVPFRILECGCGSGRYVRKLFSIYNTYTVNHEIENELHYTGFDFAEKNIQEAQFEHTDYGVENVSFFRSDMRNLDEHLIGSEKFDLIFMVATLTSIQGHFNSTIKNIANYRRCDRVPVLVMEQDMIIEYYGDWKLTK